MADESRAALIDLLRRLGETHRGVVKRDPDAVPGVEQYLAQCPACDGSRWQVWRPGDAPVSCALWREYEAYWVVRP